MVCVTIFAGVIGDIPPGCIRPWVGTHSIPGSGRILMDRSVPAIPRMTGRTQLSPDTVHIQEFSELVVMSVVAARTLKLGFPVQADRPC